MLVRHLLCFQLFNLIPNWFSKGVYKINVASLIFLWSASFWIFWSFSSPLTYVLLWVNFLKRNWVLKRSRLESLRIAGNSPLPLIPHYFVMIFTNSSLLSILVNPSMKRKGVMNLKLQFVILNVFKFKKIGPFYLSAH